MASEALLPLPRQVFYDPNGVPLAGGFVHIYVPGGTTPKQTWQDTGGTTPNSNPIILDSAGSALIYGSGSYQLTVTDADGVAIPAYSGITGSLGASTPVWTVSTIVALRASTESPPLGQIWVGGYQIVGDGGEGNFWYNPADTTTPDNGGTIIVDAGGNRWYRFWDGHKLRLLWFGGDTTSNLSTLLNAALAVATTLSATQSSVAIVLPSGSYGSSISYTYPGSAPFCVAFEGESVSRSQLNFGALDGISLTLSNSQHTFGFSNLTFVTTGIDVAIGVSVTQTAAPEGGASNLSLFQNITFIGSDSLDGSYGVECWGRAISINTASYIDYDGVSFWGAVNSGDGSGGGVALIGIDDVTKASIVHNFVNCLWSQCFNGLQLGEHVQGVTLTGCNMTGGTTGINVPDGALGPQLSISNSQFNMTADSGVNVELVGSISDVTISNSTFFVGGKNGGAIGIGPSSGGTASRISITGNSFIGLSAGGASAGIVINSNAATTGISGNSFTAFTSNAIFLGTNTTGVNVQSNTYNGNANNVQNLGTGNTVGGGSP